MLGEWTVSGIPPAPHGVPQIEVALDLDANGLLNVTARDKISREDLVITREGDWTHKEEVERMISRFASVFGVADWENDRH